VALYDVDGDGAVVLPVYVQPGAHRTTVDGRHGDMVKVRVAAPPERGRANAAVCALVAGELGVRAGDVEVVTGRTSRVKRLRVTGVTSEDVAAWLARRGFT
jgi:uncharacterized protein (TIGR00251 family)